MKKTHLVWSGVVVATLMSASAVFAANPSSITKGTTGSWPFQATKGSLFVNGNLQASKPTSSSALGTLNIGTMNYGRNTNNYTATVRVRCAPNIQPRSKTIYGPDYFAQINCSGVPNQWGATIKIN